MMNTDIAVVKKMLIDTHSHVIWGVDDGAKTFEEAVELLKMLKNQGVEKVIVTPHFNEYITEVESYQKTVEKRFNTLKSLEDMPELFLGYEFKYFRGIATSEITEMMCIGNSKYLLLELPYDDITLSTLKEIENLRYNKKIIPIVAHIDRYVVYNNYKELLKFIEEADVLAQINANSVYCEAHKRNALKLLKNGLIAFVGSDTHSVIERPPNIDKFYNIVQKKAPESLKAIEHYNEVLLKTL